MRFVTGAVVVMAALVPGVGPSPAEAPPSGAANVDFQRDVRPILSNHCFECHGPDAATRMVDLRLDTREGAFSQRPGGSLIVPGDPESSLLYQRISHSQPALRMPPSHSKRPLNSQQIVTLRKWIAQGAAWDRHWSFKPIGRPEPHSVKDSSLGSQPPGPLHSGPAGSRGAGSGSRSRQAYPGPPPGPGSDGTASRPGNPGRLPG